MQEAMSRRTLPILYFSEDVTGIGLSAHLAMPVSTRDAIARFSGDKKF